MSQHSSIDGLVHVLLVEDSETDVFLIREALKEAKLAARLHHVDNGEKCLAFLRKASPHQDAPTPDLVLLDLRMPVMTGQEVLAEMVKDTKLRSIPVVVLTTSDTECDLNELYSLRCSSYIAKPLNFEDFQHVVRRIFDYWFNMVRLPPRK